MEEKTNKQRLNFKRKLALQRTTLAKSTFLAFFENSHVF
jgi:hypothetical protein